MPPPTTLAWPATKCSQDRASPQQFIITPTGTKYSKRVRSRANASCRRYMLSELLQGSFMMLQSCDTVACLPMPACRR